MVDAALATAPPRAAGFAFFGPASYSALRIRGDSEFMKVSGPMHGLCPVGAELLADYDRVRSRTLELVAPLAADDCNIQPMPDASPPKWHLAHTSWFFETFLLKAFSAHHAPFHPGYEYLFNSYYNCVGEQYPRAERGFLSRPTLEEVLDYRRFVDERMHGLVGAGLDAAAGQLLVLGLHHEEQHQELLLTDLKCNLGRNPLREAYRRLPVPPVAERRQPGGWLEQQGGVFCLGADASRSANRRDFVFDNETPKMEVLLQSFALADRPVSSGDYLAFMADGGYARPEFWLADGWELVRRENWRAPLYWEEREGAWHYYTLGGLRPLDEAAPVSHISYFEADAYARWAGCRLPGEFEWEVVARRFSKTDGNFLETDWLTPACTEGPSLFGNVWEWTASAYAPYRGFKPAPGALGEYNGKFMNSQMVLRGGSCFTPEAHIRAGYRNFFQPSARWQMSGVRLARDLD